MINLNASIIYIVLDGSKISPTFTDSIGSQSSPLSISVSGRGNDIFLHWMSNCKGHDKETLKYGFAEGENIHDMVRSHYIKDKLEIFLKYFHESKFVIFYTHLLNITYR